MRLQIWFWLFALSAACTAQEGLVGIWQHAETDAAGTNVTRLFLHSDGTARLQAQARLVGSLANQLVEAAPADMADTTLIEVDGAGTWLTRGARLVLDLSQRQMRIDGAPFAEAVDVLAQALALSLATQLEVPEADRAELTETIRTTLAAELNEDDLLADMVSLLQTGITYELDGDRLLLDDGEGGVETWIRQLPTAVRAGSWATIKGTPRQTIGGV